jgi:hypothetical protein
MKKVWLSALIISLMLGVTPLSAIANNGDNQDVRAATRALTALERVEIIKEITSPTLNVQVAKKDGNLPEQLNYIIENADTGEVVEKGETRNGRITEKIVVSQMVKEVAGKKGSDINYTDYLLRVYNNDEEVYVMYYFSVPTFKNINSFLSNAKDNKFEDLLWIHKAHFKNTNNNVILQDVFLYEEENEELTLNLITDDEQHTSFTNTNQKLYLSTQCTLISTSDAYTAVGRITGNQNLEGSLTIDSGAKVKIDVGVNGNTSGSVSKEVSHSYGAPHTPTSPSSLVIKGNYKYNKYDCHSRDIYPYNWTEVKAVEFHGPGGSHVLTGIDGTTPSGVVNDLDIPGYFYKYTVSNGYRFENAVTVFGVTLGSEIAYSSSHEYNFKAKNKGSKVFDRGTSKKVWYSTPNN